MTSATPQATCSFTGCNLPVDPDSGKYCIGHWPGNRDKAAEVWVETRKRVREGKVDFRGWHFPHDPWERYFRGMAFPPGRASYMSGATFHEDVDFRGAQFADGAHFEPLDGRRTEFFGRALFSRATFKFAAFFHEAVFHREADFSHVVFRTAADFSGAEFRARSSFKWAEVRRHADFRKSQFNDTDFENAILQGDGRFHGATFKGELNFSGVMFEKGRNIHFDKPTSRPQPFADPAQGEAPYRLASRAAKARGDVLKADEYRLWAIRARAKRKTSTCRRAQALFLALLIWCSRRPARLLLVALVIIMAFALGYCAGDCIAPSGIAQAEREGYKPSFAECWHFSSVTFTTLGYGDLQPKPGFWRARFWAGLEAGLGAVTLAAFVVLVTRKYLP